MSNLIFGALGGIPNTGRAFRRIFTGRPPSVISLPTTITGADATIGGHSSIAGSVRNLDVFRDEYAEKLLKQFQAIQEALKERPHGKESLCDDWQVPPLPAFDPNRLMKGETSVDGKTTLDDLKDLNLRKAQINYKSLQRIHPQKHVKAYQAIERKYGLTRQQFDTLANNHNNMQWIN
jgi:hypothetical protein